MATEIGTLYAPIIADDRRFNATLASVERRAISGAASITRSLNNLPIGLPVGFGLGIAGLATAAVNAAVELDTMKRALTAVAGSSAEAERQLDRLREIAKLPGIDFAGAVQGSTRLQAVGFSAQEAERDLRAFANAVALTGGGADKLREITVQLGQMAGKGKVLAQDLRPIIESAPAVAQALQKMFGTVDSKAISDNLKKAGQSSKDFINTLVLELERIPKVTAGPREALENLGVSLKLALAGAGDVLLAGLIPVFDRLTTRLDDFVRGVKESANDIAALKMSFETLGASASGALDSIIAGLGQLTTIQTLAMVIDSVAISITIARDAAELFAASFLAGIKSITITIERDLQRALASVGIHISALDNDINRLANELPGLFDRINQGFSNTAAIMADIEENRRLIARYGAAGLVPLDPNRMAGLEGVDTGRVVPKAGGKPHAPVATGGGAHKALTDAQKLAKELASVNREISYLRNASSAEYQLKFKLDSARETKTELEKIIELRRHLFDDGSGKLSERLESLNKYTELARKAGEIKLVPANFDEFAQSIKKGADAFKDLEESINATIPKIEMTNELRLLSGDLSKEFTKLNSIEKQIILTRARNADETIRAAEATAKLKQYSQELREAIAGRHEKIVLDLKQATEKKIFDAQSRLDDFKQNIGRGFDDLISSLAEGGDRWINAAKNIGVNFFNTLASEMMLAATGGKYGSIGGLLGGLLGGVLGGFFGGGGVKLPIGKNIPIPPLGSFASGGYPQPGLAVVGEEGPELVNFGSGARVYNAEETRAMMGSKPVQVINHFHITAPGGNIPAKTQQQIAAQTGAAVDHAMRRNG